MDSLGKIVTKFAAKRPNTCHGRLPHCTNEKSTPPSRPLSVFVPDFCLYFSLAAAFPSLPTHSVQDIWEDKPQTRAETNLQNVTFQRSFI